MTKPETKHRTDDELRAERARLGIPEEWSDRHDWIRYQLNRKTNPETKRRYGQADIARQCGANEGWVSTIFAGKPSRRSVTKAGMIRRITAELLGLEEDVLFGLQQVREPA